MITLTLAPTQENQSSIAWLGRDIQKNVIRDYSAFSCLSKKIKGYVFRKITSYSLATLITHCVLNTIIYWLYYIHSSPVVKWYRCLISNLLIGLSMFFNPKHLPLFGSNKQKYILFINNSEWKLQKSGSFECGNVSRYFLKNSRQIRKFILWKNIFQCAEWSKMAEFFRIIRNQAKYSNRNSNVTLQSKCKVNFWKSQQGKRRFKDDPIFFMNFNKKILLT